MPDMKWTAEQEQVITLKNRNLLVSAAAGSGKTTVLIERILRRISDPDDPVDIDRMLIVTFTNAAAQEMRTRLYQAISKKAKEQPENRRLKRQLSLLPGAFVSTIDSFCSYILRNYYQEIGLDPSFRVGDPGEMALLKNDVLEELLEEKYREGEDDFIALSESLSTGKNDEKLRELLLKLYDYSQSAPYPAKWLRSCVDAYAPKTVEELLSTPWLMSYTESLKTRLSDLADKAEEAAGICLMPDGPLYCYEVYSDDLRQYRYALEAPDFKTFRERVLNIRFQKKPSKRGFKGDPVLEEAAAALRQKAKEGVQRKLGAQLTRPVEEELEILEKLQMQVRTYTGLVQEFTQKFTEEKRKKDLVDYSDLEHLSIEILLREGERTEVAKLLSGRFEEILIDEYQDSNYVQEEILTAVSRVPEGRNNIFMVGDMKQSIYRFRMARPELFTDKYDTYTHEDSDRQVIELHSNFRSGAPVIDAVNAVFRRLMKKSIGGIGYTKDAELYIGPQEENEEEKEAAWHRETEMLVYTDDAEEDPETPDAGSAADPEEDISGLECEARMVSMKIRELIGENTQIYDDRLKGFRRLDYGDIVILLRASKNVDMVFREALEDAGIPVYVENSQGYFETWEVRLVLDLLRIIDNPIQDIPLGAVMHSPLFDFSSEEMAEISRNYHVKEEGNGFYGALKNYLLNGTDDALKGRISAFLQTIRGYREDAVRLSLSALIRKLFSELDIELFVRAMPGGEQRMRNLKALTEKALKFEDTSYHGIFHFIRYIERLAKTDTDVGEPGSAEEAGQAVRIMTIHKSKGLEFPVVFLSGLSRKFNRTDANGTVVFHPTLGIGLDLIDYTTREKRKSLIRHALSEKTGREGVGEELRVLYVAMTRAKEKLYLTANYASEEKVRKVLDSAHEGQLSDTEILSAESPAVWLMKACTEDVPVRVSLTGRWELLSSETEEEAAEQLENAGLLSALSEEDASSEKAGKMAEEVFTYNYHYDDLRTIRGSYSVSALKKLQHEEEAEESEALFMDIPETHRKSEGPLSGAKRGTAYHTVMEKIAPGKDVHEELLRLTENGTISASEAAAVNESRIREFFLSDLWKRFERALEKGQGYREKAFIIGVPAAEVTDAKLVRSPGELVMIQGVIDMYFEEENGLVLVDYKTDRVETEEELAKRYRVQLDWYEKALRQITEKKVKEKWIWSFALGRAIRLDPSDKI